MKDDVKKNHRRIIAKALYSEILEYLDAHSGETFSKEELMGFLLSYSASCEDDKLEKTRQNDSAGAAIKERRVRRTDSYCRRFHLFVATG